MMLRRYQKGTKYILLSSTRLVSISMYLRISRTYVLSLQLKDQNDGICENKKIQGIYLGLRVCNIGKYLNLKKICSERVNKNCRNLW